jgi:hypothetical protein
VHVNRGVARVRKELPLLRAGLKRTFHFRFSRPTPMAPQLSGRRKSKTDLPLPSLSHEKSSQPLSTKG